MFLLLLPLALAPFWAPVVVVILVLSFGWTFVGRNSDLWSAAGRLSLLWCALALSVAQVGYFSGSWSEWEAGGKCLRNLPEWSRADTSAITESLWPVSSVCTSGDGASIELVPAFVTPTVVVLALTLPVLITGVALHRYRLLPRRSS